jgi:phospholipid-binding lipoprotein MlaA
MSEQTELRVHRRAAGRGVLAACLALALLLLPNFAVAEPESSEATAEPSLVGRAAEIAGSVYSTAQSRLIAPSRQAITGFFAQLPIGELYRRLSEATQGLVALTDSHVLQPIWRGSGGLAALLGQAIERPEAETPAASTAPPALAAAAPRAAALAIPGVGESDILRNLDGSDPLEPFNRLMFRLNGGLQAKLLGPASQFYLDHTSPAVQVGVGNFFHNLREPATVVSSALEGQFGDAGTAAARFGINTTLGIAGVRDPATEMGYRVRPRNLEETLCTYELPSGPYLVLPILGPATLRDAVGRIATVILYFEVMGAAIYIPYRFSDFTVEYAAVKDKIRLMNQLSGDPYTAQKAVYLALHALRCGEQTALQRKLFAR